MNPSELSVSQMVVAVQNREIDAGDLLKHYADRTVATNSTINAFREFDFGDNDSARGNTGTGKLAGVPVAIKDGICTTKFKTTASSSMLADYQAPYDATVVSKLLVSGALIAGKTNMDEFARVAPPRIHFSAIRSTLGTLREFQVVQAEVRRPRSQRA